MFIKRLYIQLPYTTFLLYLEQPSNILFRYPSVKIFLLNYLMAYRLVGSSLLRFDLQDTFKLAKMTGLLSATSSAI